MVKPPRRILIIDDDVELVTLLVDYFTLEGLQTTPAYNGPDGLAALKHGSFDLVVLDVMMPGMSGVDVLREIRSSSQIPVLMLTARGDPVDRILGLELGADDYVPKPCPPRELVARITAILRRSAHAESMIAPIHVGPVTINPSKRRVTCGDQPIELTSTEFSLFEMLARNIGSPVPKEDIYPESSRATDGSLRPSYRCSRFVHSPQACTRGRQSAGYRQHSRRRVPACCAFRYAAAPRTKLNRHPDSAPENEFFRSLGRVYRPEISRAVTARIIQQSFLASFSAAS